MRSALSNPVINRPFDPPTQHFVIGPHGPTGETAAGRRPSESFIPIPSARSKSSQVELDFDPTGERREENSLINQMRADVELWRARDYEHATAISRKLLRHWADDSRENRILYGQREAAETAIFLAECAGKGSYRDWGRALEEANAEYNGGLPRVALKMATGTGKTVVMAMLIAWQTLNRQFAPGTGRNRWSRRFLIVAPGITIRDRLHVLRPAAEDNYYDARELVPDDLRALLGEARVVIVNAQAFRPRVRREFEKVSTLGKNILSGGENPDVYNESEGELVARILRDLGRLEKGEPIVILNDEAHHCYRDRPQQTAGIKLQKDELEEVETARMWFRGIQAIGRSRRVSRVLDFSATPYFLKGSGYSEGYLFPWVVSDYSLMDAIEAGIVKVPRVPVVDDSTEDQPTYLDLWAKIGAKLPKRQSAKDSYIAGWAPPAELEGALRSLFHSYRKSFQHWERELRELREPPPVMIVVCPNTVVSKLVYEWIAGRQVGEAHSDGALDLFSNGDHGTRRARPRTILVDSRELESGDALSDAFKAAAADEISAFKDNYRSFYPGLDPNALTDADLLREVLNTVGKRDRLGEQVRCVVSVAMLTEGWDANTVTHILGVRAFGSQLLCEQVVGRGLRRRSYALDDDGFLSAEYSNVYGIPFAFIPSDVVPPENPPAPPAIEVGSVAGREHLRIVFPKLDGYRLEIPDQLLQFDPVDARRLVVAPSTVPTRVDVEGYVGTPETIQSDADDPREQRAAYRIAELVYKRHYAAVAEDAKPWTFPRLREIASDYLAGCVDYAPGFGVGELLISTERRHEAAEAIWNVISTFGERDDEKSRAQIIRPVLRRFDPVGHTGGIRFVTRKPVYETRKSEISHVVLDGPGGNTWEQLVAAQLELDDDVASYVKNDRLGFSIPYVHKGRTHSYVPDFLVRLIRRPGDVERHLVVEVSGGQKKNYSPGSTAEKADTARNSWCTSVNNHAGFGRWGYIELTTMVGVELALREAVTNLYADKAIIGDPGLLGTLT
jgi:type III restriction enzyme